MKTFILLLCCVTVASAHPSVSANAGAATTTIVGYQIGEQEANQRVWQKIVRTTDAKGNFTDQTRQAYVELATGLNHLVKGQWVASNEKIEIAADGNSASATDGRHQAYFPGDIYNGEIELVTPDGKHLHSRPVGLSYFDGKKSVLIAELTNSTGEILPSGNQVLYANAFTDFKADIRYTYTKAGFEQDIILTEQPLSPASFGLNPDTTRLEVLTEFFDPPQPTVTATTVPTDAGDLEDDDLDFETMTMMRGKAFLLGTTTPSVSVNKQWLMLDGRQMLVEEVPVVSIADELENLPLPQAALTQSHQPLNIVSAKRLLPEQRLAIIPNKNPMQLAQVTPSSRGLVLDYVTMTSQTNYTFQGDTTYYISGTVNLSGTNTFEGGAVLKYTNNASVNMVSGSVLNWKTAAYRPVIFTAKDDNSAGSAIIGSTGTPTNYYANPALSLIDDTIPASNFRVLWASQAINIMYSTESISHCQLINCLNGISYSYGVLTFENLLFANVKTNFNYISSGGVYGQNATFSGSSCMLGGFGGTLVLTNCILANVTHLTNGVVSSVSGDHNGFYNSPAFGTNIKTNTFYPFKSAGGGSYYLTNGCAFTNAGTTRIDPTLLAGLRLKTTYPPIVYSNVTFSVSTNFSPQARRDTNAAPDLGYHYDPLDYAFGGVILSSGAIATVNPGTAIGVFTPKLNPEGVYVGPSGGAQFISQGTPTSLNRIVEYNTVQESSSSAWKETTAIFTEGSMNTINCQFTDFSVMANDAEPLGIFYTGGSINFQNCQFHGGSMQMIESEANFINCLFERVAWTIEDDPFPVTYRNNLFWNNSSIFFLLNEANSLVQDNMFYKSTIRDDTSISYIMGYNGYYTTNGTFLRGTNNTDQILTNDVGYQPGALGNYYLPPGSPLIDKGSTNSGAVGMNFFTTQTNQTADTGTVDIGYHYYITGIDSTGTNFWLTFLSMPQVYGSSSLQPSYWTLNIASPLAATGTVSMPGLIGNGPILVVSNCGDSSVDGTYVLTNVSVAEQDAWTYAPINFLYVKGTNQVIGSAIWNGQWDYEWYSIGYDGGSGITILYADDEDTLTSTNWEDFEDPNPNPPTTSCAQSSFSESYSVMPGTATRIMVPLIYTNTDVLITNGINVTANQPVSVYALFYAAAASTAFTAYPTPLLGTNYCLMTRPLGDASSGDPCELAIVATANNTTNIITPSATANLVGQSGTYTNILQQGEVYQISSSGDTNDVTGTLITSSQPIAVFAGTFLAYVPDINTFAGNPLIQEQLPVDSWGTQALALSFAGRTNGDSYRVLAAYSNTVVTITGSVVTVVNENLPNGPWTVTATNEVVVTNLTAGVPYDIIVDGPVEFQGSQPIQVAQFANGTESDVANGGPSAGVVGDPCEILLPPVGQYLETNVVFTGTNDFGGNGSLTGDFPENYLNIIVVQSATNSTLVDGSTVAATNFVTIGTSGYCGAQLFMTNGGAHTVISSQPVSVEVYGWGHTDGYGYFGGVVK